MFCPPIVYILITGKEMQVMKVIAMKRIGNSWKWLGDPREVAQTTCKDADRPENVSFPTTVLSARISFICMQTC